MGGFRIDRGGCQSCLWKITKGEDAPVLKNIRYSQKKIKKGLYRYDPIRVRWLYIHNSHVTIHFVH